MTDEEYVRTRIEEVHDNGVCLWVVLDRIYTFSPSHGKPIADAWLRLCAFTEQREREIAEVSGCVDLLKESIGVAQGSATDVTSVAAKLTSTLKREQAVLAELRRGMKEGSE